MNKNKIENIELDVLDGLGRVRFPRHWTVDDDYEMIESHTDTHLYVVREDGKDSIRYFRGSRRALDQYLEFSPISILRKIC